MAESVVKLRLESGEYDSKIKRAAQNVLEFGQNCQKAGQSVAKADKDTLDYVRSIGQMETVAKNAKGKINEMTNAFTDLSVQYKNLTDDEKKSPFGQSLSQSLDQLKNRINESKAQLQDVTNELGNTGRKGNETGGVMQQLANKFTINIDAIKLFNAGLAATKMALNVAKDAFFASESSADEWGRTIESGRAIYDSFLQTLNSGNFGNFFANLDNVIAKARAAHDAIDDLNTAMTIINPERAKLQTRQTQLQSTIRREGANSEAGRRAQEELKALEPRLQSSYRTESGMNWNAFTALVDEKLATAGINLDKNSRDFLLRSFHSMDAYERLKRNARGSRTYQGGESIGTTSYGTSVDNGRWVDTRNTNQKLLDLFTDEWRQQNSGYLTASFNALGQSYGMLRGNARYLNSGTGGGGSRGGTGRGGGGGSTVAPPPEGSIAAQEAEVARLTKLWREATTQVGRDGYAGQLEAAKKTLSDMQGKVDDFLTATPVFDMNRGSEQMSIVDKIRTSISDSNIAADEAALSNILEHMMRNGIDTADFPADELYNKILGPGIPDEKWQEIVADINEKLANAGLEPIEIDVKTGNITKVAKEVCASWQDAAHAVQAVGSALQSIQDPTAKILGIIGQAIANVALGFAQATTAESGKGIWAWIAAIAGGVGTMVSTISAIHSATGYSEGGIIKGTSYSGDNIMANGGTIGLNAQEIVLNRAQAGNLAAQLSDTSAGADRRPYLDVETIWLGMGHYLKRRGMGEIVTSK
jgi:hypothetical protein